jgi:hypothetical protein
MCKRMRGRHSFILGREESLPLDELQVSHIQKERQSQERDTFRVLVVS